MIIDRVNKLKHQVFIDKLDAVVITDVFLINYLTNYGNFSNEEREAFLVITPKTQYILTDGRYTTAIKNEVKHFELLEIDGSNSLENVLKNLSKKHNLKVIGLDFNDITHNEYKFFKKIFSKIKHVELGDLRVIKEASEINLIKKACEIGDKAFEYALKQVKVGVSEKDLSCEIELFVKKLHASMSFETIVAFGKNAAVPHHQTGDEKLDTKDKFVLIDMGVKLDGYCSDMTRTVFFGKPTPEQIKIYNTVKEAQQKAVEFIQKQLNNGLKIKATDVDKVARDYIVAQGFNSIPHSLGHGIGLQVHELPNLSPKSKQYLEEGMVFSIEPGIYIPDFGGVRIEDLFCIQNGEIIQLTASEKDMIIIN